MKLESENLDTVKLERIRWRCRRGLLELDIVFGHFIPHYVTLDSQQQLEFDKLLDKPDTELWDLISGKLPGEYAAQSALLALINSV